MTHRIGRVAERDAKTARVRVVFGAEDGMLSWWLPVLQAKTGADKVYWMPDVEEHVVCLLDERAEFGVVLGAIYSEVDKPPVASLDRLHVAMKDGTTIDYNRESHRLEVTVAGGDLVLNVDQGASVHVGGEGGDQLVTKQFITSVFLKHTHPTGTGPSGPPIPTGTEAVPPHVTQKGKSE